jgi:hypothetical protein
VKQARFPEFQPSTWKVRRLNHCPKHASSSFCSKYVHRGYAQKHLSELFLAGRVLIFGRAEEEAEQEAKKQKLCDELHKLGYTRLRDFATRDSQ